MDITKRYLLDVLLLDVDNEWPDAVIERHGSSEAVVTVNNTQFYVNAAADAIRRGDMDIDVIVTFLKNPDRASAGLLTEKVIRYLLGLAITADEETQEFNAGYEAYHAGLKLDDEPDKTRHDVWRIGWVWGWWSQHEERNTPPDSWCGEGPDYRPTRPPGVVFEDELL